MQYLDLPYYGLRAMPKPRKSLFDDGYLAIIDALIAHRKSIGMSQEALGEAYGEDQTFISRIERKQRRLDVWEFVRMCRCMHIEPGDMLASIPI